MDEQRRVLLVEDGRLTEVDGTSSSVLMRDVTAARYLPGERTVVVQHGRVPRLSVLKPGGRPYDLVGTGEFACELLGVLPGRAVYRTNRRHRLLFDVVIRSVLLGEEQAVYRRGGAVQEAAVSPNSRHVAVRLPHKLQLVDTMPVTEDDHVRLLSTEAAGGGHRHLHWLPDSKRLVASVSAAESTEVARYDLTKRAWTTLVSTPVAGAVGVPSPDGRLLAVVGGTALSVHLASNGNVRHEVTLDGAADVSTPTWTPDSSHLVVSAGEDVVVLGARTGRRSTL